MCLRLLRAEIWARDDVKKLHRVTIRTMPDALVDGPAVVVVSRLVVTGGNHHRLHEELTVSGGYLRDQSFRREEGVTRVQQWLDESKPITAAPPLFDALRVRFDRQQEAILKAVDARSKERLRYLTNTLQTRKQQEIEDIGTVLDELEKAIQSELKKGEQPEQLTLFTEDERTQLHRDIAALEARLARIPGERQMETQAIESRYAKLDDRTFPVAVIFVVPESTLEVAI
ncbi:SNF2-like protein [Burkholderia pseudomallei]|nr:SNF2-like protein [Burkholderia pseudomallei]VBP09180.1 SNF2-like protein [Burkholderia pseudomallei]